MGNSENEKLVPDFLIIGAMKAGTTSLYRDLAAHPKLFLPEEKEPECLVSSGDDVVAIETDYKSLFRGAKPFQLKGEASTAYTKRPVFEGVAQRAHRICGSSLKLIYITRDPIRRIISQYDHERAYGLVKEPLNDAVLLHSRFVDFSRYEWQLQSWLDIFGEGNVLRLSFEHYTADRTGTAARVCEFLGIDPAELPPTRDDLAFNASKNRPTAATGLFKMLIASRLYQRHLKPRIPWELRGRVAEMVLPKTNSTVEVLRPEVEAQLRTRLGMR